jgi:hypothetical protein
MLMTVSYEEMVAAYWWPFPPPEDRLGWIYPWDSPRFGPGNTAVYMVRSAESPAPPPGRPGELFDAVPAPIPPGLTGLPDLPGLGEFPRQVAVDGPVPRTPLDERALWVAYATNATITQTTAFAQAASTLPDAAESIDTANRAALATFVDGLLESPPACDLVPVRPPGFPVVVIVVVGGTGGPFPGPPPHWEQGEQLGRIDLIGAGIRFQTVAASTETGPLRETLLSAASRLFEAALTRS